MHIDLNAKLRELERKKNPPTLDLYDRTYTFRAVVPIEGGLVLANAPERDEDAEGWRLGVIQFVAALLIDEDQDDWLDATLDRDQFPDELLDATIIGLAQEYVARPTPPSTGSLPGPATSGGTSKSEPSGTASATSAA